MKRIELGPTGLDVSAMKNALPVDAGFAGR